ncbi:MAG: hypothetical protein WBV37_00435, partial [Nocardioidaceae bacterium]
MPRKTSPKPLSARDIEPEGGPRSWMLPRLEAAHTAMRRREDAATDEAARASSELRFVKARSQAARPPKARHAKAAPLVSRLQPGRADDVLAEPTHDFWRTRFQEYYVRKAKTAAAVAGAPGLAPAMPAVPGANNWI